MGMTESHARELARQAARKAELRALLERDLAGVERVLLEAGCGHGHWLTSYAESHPGTICVGVDLISWRIRKGLDKRDKRGLRNLRFYKAELYEFLEALPRTIRLEGAVLLFPDPWPKARHHRRRMAQTALLDELASRVDEGGQFCFRSDDRPYYEWVIERLEAHPDWRIHPSAAWPHECDTYFQDMMDEYFSVVALRKGPEAETDSVKSGPARGSARSAR